MRTLSRLATFLGIFILIAFAAPRANAIQISPPVREIVADPGDVVHTDIKVIGSDDQLANFKISIEEFKFVGEDNDREFFIPEPSQSSIGNWISFDKEQATYEVEYGKVVNVPYILTIPKDAAPGGHYGALVVISTGGKLENESGVAVTTRVVGQIYLTISGDLHHDLQIESFVIGKHPWFFAHLPVYFETRLRNPGNVHQTPIGYIEALEGEKKATVIEFNPKKVVVFPNTVRRFTNEWPAKEEITGSNEFERFFSHVQYEIRNFQLGVYDVRLGVSYGDPRRAIQTTRRILIFPWHLILLILVFVLLIIFLTKFTQRQYRAVKRMISGRGKMPRKG